MSEPAGTTSPLAVIDPGSEAPDGDEPPSRGPRNPSSRHPAWLDVPDSRWNDWRWQSQNAVRNARQLGDLLAFSPEERRALDDLTAQYKLAIPPYYFSLIDRADPTDPIRLQSVPSPLELLGAIGTEEDDPLDEDKDSPVPGLTHRYPDRALLVTTHVCTMYCRFCTRKRATMKRGGWDSVSRDDRRMVEYVRDHPEIRDVIVSGGDPLTLPPDKLAFFVENLSAIDHLDVIRIGTRVPVTLPQRLFEDEVIDILSTSDKIWIQTHFNHPREVTPESALACKRLRMAGMPINNHAVLLKGVNDSLATQKELCRALLRIKVRPYYLFHCDPVTGAGHFRTNVWKGIEIIEGLRGHLSGLGVPTYVVDAPRGGGKIPLMPNYLLSASNDSVVLRNYEGMIVHYHPTGETPEITRAVETQGVSGLLEGHAEVLIPEGNPRPCPASLATALDRQIALCERSRRAREAGDGVLKVGMAFDLAPVVPHSGSEALDDRFEEFDKPETVEAIAEVIRGQGHEVVPLGDGREFLARVLADRPDFVFNIAEGEGVGRSREARVPAVLEMLGIPYSGSDPLTLAASLDKVMAKRLVKTGTDVRYPRGWSLPADLDEGTSILELLFDESDPVGRRGDAESMPPLILKPMFEGSSKGIRGKCIADHADEAIEIYRNLAGAYAQPILAEEYIEGDEVTVGLVGNNPSGRGGNSFVIGSMRIVPRRSDERFVYSLEVKRDWRNRVDYETTPDLPDPVLAALTVAALDVSASLQCRDVARIDFRVRDGVPYFIEANPLPGLAPVTSDLVILAQGHGIEYPELILRIFHASLARVGLK